MTELITNYIAMDTICAAALIVLAYASCNNVLFTAKVKKQFILAALFAITVIAAELGSVVFENIWTTNRFPAFIANTIGFSFSPIIAIVLSEAFLIEKGKVRSFLTIPVWLNFVLVISSPWTGLIFKVNADISYIRGPLFGVYVGAYLCSCAILIMVSVKAMKYYQCNSNSTLIMLLVFTITGTTVQLILPYVHVSWLCVTLSLILFYAYFCTISETQDTLSGLLNRNVYDQYTSRLDHDISGTVIVFDLDSFKQINDLFGHQWGDFCLQTTGKLIKDCFYEIGLCYRIGGDEFCVICETIDEQQTRDSLRHFHQKIAEVRKNKNLKGELPMVSTGYAVFHGLAGEFDVAMKKADAQMYGFKNKHKRTSYILQKQ